MKTRIINQLGVGMEDELIKSKKEVVVNRFTTSQALVTIIQGPVLDDHLLPRLVLPGLVSQSRSIAGHRQEERYWAPGTISLRSLGNDIFWNLWLTVVR
ncbi:hypothetical protein R6Q59_010078 [Mikania micrantha]